MSPSGGLWPLLTILGPILIILAIAYAIWRNKQSTNAEVDRTERATHDLYKEQDAADKADSRGGDDRAV